MFLKQDMTPFEGYIIQNTCAPKHIFSTTLPFLTLKNRLFKHAVVPISFKNILLILLHQFFVGKPQIFLKSENGKKERKSLFLLLKYKMNCLSMVLNFKCDS